VDFQSSWRTSPGEAGTDFGHAHVGGCIPEREKMQGETIPLADDHQGISDTLLEVGPAPYGPAPLNAPVETMSAGTHKLNMRADCADPHGSTNSGVLVLPLEVG
jgi:hypothetical protein